MKLWDYSHLKGNIQGRVAPQISFFWGIGVVLLVKFVQPFIQRIINWEESWTHEMLALIIVLVMGTDTILSVISVEKFHITTQQWDERAAAYRKELLDRLEKAAPKDKLAIKDHLQDCNKVNEQAEKLPTIRRVLLHIGHLMKQKRMASTDISYTYKTSTSN